MFRHRTQKIYYTKKHFLNVLEESTHVKMRKQCKNTFTRNEKQVWIKKLRPFWGVI